LANKKIEKRKPYVSKQQQTKWERQKKRQRIVGIAGIAIIATAIILVIVGWLVGSFFPLNETVITVNDRSFSMKYYVDSLKMRAGENPSKFTVQYIADSVIKDIEQNELIRLGAAKLGFTVSDKEVVAELKKAKQPLDAVHKDAMRTILLARKMLAEYFDPQVPRTAEQRHLMAMLLESRTQAQDVRYKLEQGINFSEQAEIYSLDELTKNARGDLGWHPKEIFTKYMGYEVPGEWAFNAQVNELSQPLWDGNVTKKLGYWLVKVMQRGTDTEEVQVKAMLLGSEEEALKVRERLLAGEDFSTVAVEVSQVQGVKESKGDHVVLPGEMNTAVDDFVFNTEIPLGTLSNPLKDETASTKGGFWLVKVLAQEADRQISEEDRNTLKASALQKWIEELWADTSYTVDHSKLDTVKINQAIALVSKK